jgi:cytochrome c-type biogenesis protein CcmH
VVARLESELQQNADNPEGWYLLGSTYMTLQRFSDAARAFGKLRELVGDEPDLLVREADALAMANQGVLAGAPENLLERALALNPDHPVALWLSGIAADRRGDVEQALRYWQRAEPLFADNPQSQAEIRTQISRAKSQLAGGGAGMVVAEGSSAPTEQPIADGGAIQVRVSLDDTLRADVSGNETLFILARAVAGPPMPLAVVRKRAADLPLVVTLDDSMAMMPNLKLSGHDQVTVLAKLSKSGNATTQSGDFIGKVTPVTPGTTDPVNVVISTISP